MTTGQGLWVGSDVLQPVDARMGMAGLLATNSADPFDVRTGVLYAGVSTLVTGTSGLSVNVAPLQFVSSKGSSNGPYVGTNKTTTPVTVPAAPALGSKRIDVVWVAQQDATATISADASTVAVFGVVTGVAGSSPSKPALPAGTTEVGTVTWDSTSTVAAATNAAQCTLATTCQWTAARGAPIPVRTTSERAALSPYLGMGCIRLDIGGQVQTYDGSTWRGQRRHAGFQTKTTDASGYATVTHGAGFTPASVQATALIAWQVATDSFNSTTFRARFLDSGGVPVGSTSISFSYDCTEALT